MDHAPLHRELSALRHADVLREARELQDGGVVVALPRDDAPHVRLFARLLAFFSERKGERATRPAVKPS